MQIPDRPHRTAAKTLARSRRRVVQHPAESESDGRSKHRVREHDVHVALGMQGDECGGPYQPGLRRLATRSQVLQADPDRRRPASGRSNESARAHAPRREPDGRARPPGLADQPADLGRRRPDTGSHGPRRRVSGSDRTERLRRGAPEAQGALGPRHRSRRERGKPERAHDGPTRGAATRGRARRNPGPGGALDAADRLQLRAGAGRAEEDRRREPTATVPGSRRHR